MTKTPPRFERRGGAPDLPAAFTAFVTGPLRGRTLDDQFNTESAEGEFPDFGVYRDLLLIEMKHLETDQQERIQAVLDEKIAPAEMPIFYGQRPMTIAKGSFSNADEIVRAVLTKLNRSLEGPLSKANRQFRSYRARHPRKNAVNICLILNSKHADFTPEIVAHALHAKMKQTGGGAPRFESIDAVLYISEKHFIQLPDGRAALPIAIHENLGMLQNEWKRPILDQLVAAWSEFRTGGPPEFSDDPRGFGTVEDIPDRMTRSDVWRLEYARDPYLQDLTIQDLRVFFQRTVAWNARTFVKGDWPKPKHEETADGMRRFTHSIEEVNRRGLDMREMDARKMTRAERDIVFTGLPEDLVKILRKPAVDDR